MLESPGTPKVPEPCHSDRDCIETEACFMGLCQNPCEFDNVCGIGANCQPVKQRPMCSCPAGHDGDPAVKCSPKICKLQLIPTNRKYIEFVIYLLYKPTFSVKINYNGVL